jgi:signal transduction histidine kinase
VVKEMLQSIAVKYNLKEKGLDPATIPEVVDLAFAKLVQKAVEEAPATPLPLSASKVVVSHQPEAGPGASLQAAPDAGLVSEELLHRAIKSNVELAEALAGLVQSMNQGLSTILSHAELLMVYREDAREKRLQAVTSIQTEANRLRRIMQELGQAGSAATAGATPAPAAPIPDQALPVSAHHQTARVAHLPPVPVVAAPQPAPPPQAGPTANAAVRDAVAAARAELQARGVSVEMRVPPVVLSPRVPAPRLTQALTRLLEHVARQAPQGSSVEIRAERKPVLLRGRDGSEIKRDFLMLATAHHGELTAEQQQGALHGSDAGPLGQACSTVKNIGGFVRFAPLGGGRQETRFFVPAT